MLSVAALRWEGRGHCRTSHPGGQPIAPEFTPPSATLENRSRAYRADCDTLQAGETGEKARTDHNTDLSLYLI